MNTKLFPVDDLEDMLYGASSYLTCVDRTYHSRGRWDIQYNVVFKSEQDDKLYQVAYHEPATEYQDGQERFEIDLDDMVMGIEVEPYETTVVMYRPVE